MQAAVVVSKKKNNARSAASVMGRHLKDSAAKKRNLSDAVNVADTLICTPVGSSSGPSANVAQAKRQRGVTQRQPEDTQQQDFILPDRPQQALRGEHEDGIAEQEEDSDGEEDEV